MAIKRPKPEEIVVKLRQVEVLMGQGMPRIDAISPWVMMPRHLVGRHTRHRRFRSNSALERIGPSPFARRANHDLHPTSVLHIVLNMYYCPSSGFLDP